MVEFNNMPISEESRRTSPHYEINREVANKSERKINHSIYIENVLPVFYLSKDIHRRRPNLRLQSRLLTVAGKNFLVQMCTTKEYSATKMTLF